MIISTADNRQLQVKSTLEDWPWLPPLPESFLGGQINLEKAIGLPALLACLYRLGEGFGLMPQLVYRGTSANREKRERAADSWQWKLLHERPNSDGIAPSTFRADIAFSLAASGNAYIRKFKSTTSRRVVELVPLDPTKVTPKRSGGQVVFEDRTESQPETRDATEIIHVRGISLNGKVRGISRVTAARLAINTGLKRQAFEHAYYERNAEARVVLKFPQSIDQTQAKEWVEVWDAEHQGEENWHGTAALGGGAELETIPVSLQDAQFVEANRYTIDLCAGLFCIPLPLVAGGRVTEGLTEGDRLQFVTFALGPIYTAIDGAFSADRDLFPEGDDLFVESLPDALLKATTKERYEAYKAARQAGWLTANEIRALENYPPRPEGEELQATPVGGAPNKDTADLLRQLAGWIDGEEYEPKGNGHRPPVPAPH